MSALADCHKGQFKLYKQWQDSSLRGDFIHVKERFYCGTGFCVIDPREDASLIPRIMGSLNNHNKKNHGLFC